MLHGPDEIGTSSVVCACTAENARLRMCGVGRKWQKKEPNRVEKSQCSRHSLRFIVPLESTIDPSFLNRTRRSDRSSPPSFLTHEHTWARESPAARVANASSPHHILTRRSGRIMRSAAGWVSIAPTTFLLAISSIFTGGSSRLPPLDERRASTPAPSLPSHTWRSAPHQIGSPGRAHCCYASPPDGLCHGLTGCVRARVAGS